MATGGKAARGKYPNSPVTMQNHIHTEEVQTMMATMKLMVIMKK